MSPPHPLPLSLHPDFPLTLPPLQSTHISEHPSFMRKYLSVASHLVAKERHGR